MLWSTNKKKEETDRDRKIKELREAFPNTRKPFNDDTAFEILFTVNNVWCTCKIFLTGDFPIGKPTIQIVGALSHPWLDQYKQVIGCPKLTGWSRTSSLVEVTRDIISALQSSSSQVGGSGQLNSTPPSSRVPSGSNLSSMADFAPPLYPTLPNVNPPLFPPNSRPTNQNNGYQSPPSYDMIYRPMPTSNISTTTSITSNLAIPQNYRKEVTSHSGTVISQKPPQKPPKAVISIPTLARDISETKIPDIPIEFPELENLTTAELERFLSDGSAIKAHAISYAEIESLQSMSRETRQSNKDLLTSNLLQRDELLTAQEIVQSLQSQLSQELREYANLMEALHRAHFRSSEDIISEVEAKRAALNDETERIAKKFTLGEMELSAFLHEYIEKRNLYHSLLFKLSHIR